MDDWGVVDARALLAEVPAAHVWSKDSGVPRDCIFQHDLKPLSGTMKSNWVSMKEYIMSSHLMNQTAVWRNTENILNTVLIYSLM